MPALNDQTRVAIANRFVVTVDQSKYNLGSWSKAEGLDVTWDMPEYRAGDAGNHRWFFPANTKYKSVKLARAACPDSATVQDWLKTNSQDYNSSRGPVHIALFDSLGKEAVITWILRNATPKSWSINSMDAGASQVSIETIEFDHEGFLEDEMKIGG